MTREARYLRCPENVLGWIPWYADGSLSARERGAVEAHASECPDCRAELDMIAGTPFEIDVELPDPDRAFAEILARIHQDADPPSARDLQTKTQGGGEAADPAEDGARIDALARIEEWGRAEAPEEILDTQQAARGGQDRNRRGRIARDPWASSPKWAAAAAIALLCFGVLAGAMFTSAWDRFSTGDIYVSATAPAIGSSATAIPTTPGAVMIDVVFRESATASEIAAALHSLGGEIVSGPTNLGVYRVRISPGSIDPAGNRSASAFDLDVAFSRLKARADGVAIFAEVAP